MGEPGDTAARSTTRVLARMPMLRELVEHLRADGMRFDNGVFVFGIQHIMDQTLALCWALNALGLPYERIALCGKAYSYCPESAAELTALGVVIPPPRAYDPSVSQASQMVADLAALAGRVAAKRAEVVNSTLLVLDDGGQALTNVANLFTGPQRILGVEQTASGFWQPGISSIAMPVVDVGTSAVKSLCEPAIIIETALRHATRSLELRGEGVRVGVVGLGHIGLRLSHVLKERGYALSVYDHRPDAYYHLDVERARRVHDVIETSDVIFGCTGSDITRDLAWEASHRGLSPRSRAFLSLSSGDDEFFTLKQLLLVEGGAPAETYAPGEIPDIVGRLWGSPFTIIRNGFPINFDNTRVSAPLDAIQGTISALVGALCQVYLASRNRRSAPVAERIVVDPALQRWLLKRWREVLDAPLRFRNRIVTAEPQDAMLMKLSQVRSDPVSIRTAPVFGPWTES